MKSCFEWSKERMRRWKENNTRKCSFDPCVTPQNNKKHHLAKLNDSIMSIHALSDQDDGDEEDDDD